MGERIQKILSARGVASRRRAEELILAGRVTVNGTVCHLGDRADGTADEIAVDGVPIAAPSAMTYIMLNKPRGYVTTRSDEKGRRTVLELVNCGVRVYPVGRLDMDSEGLLLLTNDGALTNRLIHPAGEVPKTYRVWLREADREKLRAMERPLTIDGQRLRPAVLELQWLREGEACALVTIREGKNRQIRKMAEVCGMRVTRLCRIAEGPIALGDLKKGAWRYLTEEEILALKQE